MNKLLLGALLVAPFCVLGTIVEKESLTEKEILFYPASYSSDFTAEPKYSEQYIKTFQNINLGNIPETYRGEGVKVAVIDSGINYEHEDFLLGGETIVQGNSQTCTTTKYSFSSYPDKINDTLGHGTNVASVIASQINSIGCAGIAPNVELYVYKVTNSANAYPFNYINLALQDCIDRGIDIINMSFQSYEHDVSYGSSSMTGVAGCSTALAAKINACNNAGIVMIAAAGNYNTSEPSYPACNAGVISVGSLADGSLNTKAGFSNYGSIDIVAPGYVSAANIGSTNAYKNTSGTSFSAPIVTAAAALLKCKYPDLTSDEVYKALVGTADYIEGADSWAGFGRLNVTNLLTNYDPAVVTDITITSGTTVELTEGETSQISVDVYPESASDKSLSYTVSSGSSYATVSDSGLITAVAPGTATIQVTSVSNPSVFKNISVKVSKAPIVVPTREGKYIKVTDLSKLKEGSRIFLGAGTSSAYYAMKTYTSGNNIAAQSITQSNTFTVTAGDGIGTYILENGTVAGTFGLKDENGKYIGASSSSSNYLKAQNNLDVNASFAITVKDASAYTYQIKSSGSYTRNTIFLNGTIFSCYVQTSSTYKSPNIYVREDETYPTDFTITGDTSMFVGDSTTLGVTYTPSTATVKNVTWSSETPLIASVNDSGVVTALKAGTATIRATIKKSATLTMTKTYNITVSNIGVTGVSLDITSKNLVVDSSFDLTATVAPSNATNKNVTWSSNHPEIASVTNGTVTGNSVGNAIITATTEDGSYRATCNVTVEGKATLESLEILGLDSSLDLKETFNMSSIVVNAVYSDASKVDVTTSATITGTIDTTVIGKQSIRASYTEDGVTKNAVAETFVTNANVKEDVGESSAPVETPKTDTSTFTTASWGTGSGQIQWSSGKNGASFMSDGRGIQVTTTATGANATTSTSYAKVKQVVIHYSTNAKAGAGSYTVKVGNNDEVTRSDITTGNDVRDLTFDFATYLDGNVKITLACSTNSLYIAGVDITYVTLTPGKTYKITPTEQALAWSKYFNAYTASYCDPNGVNTNVTMLTSIWSEVANEYTYMNDLSKDVFFSSVDAEIALARKVYTVIVVKYGLNNFAVNSGDQPLVTLSASPLKVAMNSANTSLIIASTAVVLGSLSAALYLRKRKNK